MSNMLYRYAEIGRLEEKLMQHGIFIAVTNQMAVNRKNFVEERIKQLRQAIVDNNIISKEASIL